VAALFIVRDAALTGGHDADQATGANQRLQALDRPHHAQRVRQHDAHELVGRCLGDGFRLIAVGGARIDEQHLNAPTRQPTTERRDLIGFGDIERFDRDLVRVRLGEIVQLAPAVLTYRTDDVPTLFYELASHRQPKAARRPDEQDGLRLLVRSVCHDVDPLTCLSIMWANGWHAPDAQYANDDCTGRYDCSGRTVMLPIMATIDLNLLTALDVLLTERSVTAAARRMGLSVSAMSRTLTRLRSVTGDPLLVQAGRSLVPTPYAERLVERAQHAVQEARSVLAPAPKDIEPVSLDRTFTIRANEGFVVLFACAIVEAIVEVAPLVRLRFAPKPDKVVAPLRDGSIDLEIGTTGASAPEMRSQLLFRDRFVGAVRDAHPLLVDPITPERYAACGHVAASRRGAWEGPVDEALHDLGLQRRVIAMVPGFLDALAIARRSDLVALVPRLCVRHEGAEPRSVVCFDIPVPTPELAISMMWHPRLDADPGHRWLRQVVMKCVGPASRDGR
jgi:DNA-binding transcriptional LysR family regulator